LGDFGVVFGLGAEPVAVGEGEETAEAEVGVGRHRAAAGDDFADPLGGDADFLGEAILGEAEGEEEFLAEELAGGDGGSFGIPMVCKW
jgi:hypothetical protein